MAGVQITRVSQGRYRADNGRGGVLEFGHGDTADFTPVELLLAALGGCAGVDVDLVMSRRGEPDEFTIAVHAEKVREQTAAGEAVRLDDIRVDFQVRMPPEQDAEATRRLVERVVRLSHDRDCTVSRTIEQASPVTMTVS